MPRDGLTTKQPSDKVQRTAAALKRDIEWALLHSGWFGPPVAELKAERERREKDKAS